MKTFAALLALGMLVPLLLAAREVMEVPAAFDLSSALAGLVGSIWIAAGAVLSRREAKQICKPYKRRLGSAGEGHHEVVIGFAMSSARSVKKLSNP
jgi:hypothetical protein